MNSGIAVKFNIFSNFDLVMNMIKYTLDIIIECAFAIFVFFFNVLIRVLIRVFFPHRVTCMFSSSS